MRSSVLATRPRVIADDQIEHYSIIIVSHNSFSRFCCHMERSHSTEILQATTFLLYSSLSIRHRIKLRNNHNFSNRFSFSSDFIIESNRLSAGLVPNFMSIEPNVLTFHNSRKHKPQYLHWRQYLVFGHFTISQFKKSK